MEKKIIVRNTRVISEYFNIKLDLGVNLLEREEDNIKEFIKKYEEELFGVNYDKFKDFTKETGIIITRVYQKRNDFNLYIIDELGISSKYENKCNIPVIKDHVFKSHLTIFIQVDDILEENECIYEITNEEKRLIYKKNEEYDKKIDYGYSVRHVIYNNDLTLESKINKINELVPCTVLSEMKQSDIKQIECPWPFEDILVLTKNGELFVNDKLYASGVKELCRLASYRTYIIFNNESVEFYTNKLLDTFEFLNNKKVLTDNGTFLIQLDNDKCVLVTTIVDEDLVYSGFDIDCAVEFYLHNIDDISYTTNGYQIILNLYSNKAEIKLPLDIVIQK